MVGFVSFMRARSGGSLTGLKHNWDNWECVDGKQEEQEDTSRLEKRNSLQVDFSDVKEITNGSRRQSLSV